MTRRELDQRIREICQERGWRFKPWELRPDEVSDNGPSPWPAGSGGSISWPRAQRLRKRLVEEIERDVE